MISSDQFGGVVRAVLAAVGGYAVGQGLVDEATMLTIVGGLTSVAVAVWSVWAKRPKEE